ncbi:MAG: MBL fold metallo-hydrolase [Halobacteriales archaeon]|nr:MBL fold metallo-hydrolase [Halobacteriales archaeon]
MHERVDDEDVYVIDTVMLGVEGHAAAFLIDADKPVIIDTGLQDCARNVLDAVEEIGVAHDDVEHIVVTHVHLDHAGGIGEVAEACPNAEILVHESGEKYLTDDESARRLVEKVHAVEDGLGDAYGGIDTVDSDRVVAVEDEKTLDLGDRELEIFETSGHAPHHLSLYDDESDALFVIDEGCAYFEGQEGVTTPPSNFDYERTLESFDRFEEYDSDYLLYGHYGVNYDGADALPRHREALVEWVEDIRDAWEEHGDTRAVIEQVVEGRPEAENPTVRAVLERDVRGVLIDLGR